MPNGNFTNKTDSHGGTLVFQIQSCTDMIKMYVVAKFTDSMLERHLQLILHSHMFVHMFKTYQIIIQPVKYEHI